MVERQRHLWDGFKAYEHKGLEVASEAVSAELTRSLTLFESLKRLVGDGDGITHQEVSVLLLGADYVEARVPEKQFHALARLLGNCGVTSLRLLFVGPNLDASIDKTERELRFAESGSESDSKYPLLPRTRVWFKTGVYHAKDAGVEVNKVDLVMCFHPGFWGYDSWRETIQALPRDVPCVVTSYNKEEAEDDQDVVIEALEGRKEWNWRWRIERNKFASKVERESGIEGRPCVENKFWQAFVVTGDVEVNVNDESVAGV